MAYEQKDNSGSLFANDKRTSDKAPNAKGKAMIGGVMYWVSAWTRVKDDGSKWQSLAFTLVDETKVPQQPKPKEPLPGYGADDSPF